MLLASGLLVVRSRLTFAVGQRIACFGTTVESAGVGGPWEALGVDNRFGLISALEELKIGAPTPVQVMLPRKRDSCGPKTVQSAMYWA